MKNFHEENYYALLELSPDASVDQIHRAYEHAKRTFSDDSLAVYSLYSREERRRQLEKIEQAYRVLMNESSRRQYDRRLNLPERLHQPAAPAPASHDAESRPASEAPLPSADRMNGPSLRRVRERIGISLEEVALQTRIRQTYLECIEGDEHEKLPPDVYLKSYLSDYARALGLDSQKVVEGYLKNRPSR